MADEQMQHSDLIDDAIREAEQQLEAKLEALRLSAMGDVHAASDPSAAHLRPTGHASGWSEPTFSADPAPRHEPTNEDEHDHESGGEPGHAPQSGWQTPAWVETPLEAEDRQEPASWQDSDPDEDADAFDIGTVGGSAPAAPSGGWSDAVLQQTAADEQQEPWRGETFPSQAHDYEHEPGGSWASTGDDSDGQDGDSWRGDAPVTRHSDSELEFWAQTRTALRHLQQTTDALPQRVSTGVSETFEQAAQRMGRLVTEEFEAPTAAIRQLHEEVPLQLERIDRTIRDGFEEQIPQRIERLERSIQSQLHEDVDRFEQSVATNVTRLAQGLETRVDTSDDQLRSEFERIEHTMRSQLDRVERSVRDELTAPIESIRQLHDELPLQFSRVERALREQGRDVAAEVRAELGSVVGELTSLSRTTLDRISGVSGELDRDRLQRVEDLELVIDSLSSGWQGLYAGMSQLTERTEDVDVRLAGIERRLDSMRNLERTVDDALAGVREQLETHLVTLERHMADLQPAPVMVTVNHPEAQVSQTTRGGYVSGGQESGQSSSY